MAKHILIVDDEEDLLSNLTHSLEHYHYEVSTANCLADAKKKLASVSPDLLILDIMLPDGSGLELLNEIRSRENDRDLPVILLSALNQHVVPPEASGDERLAYMNKPYSVPHLLEIMERMVKN